MLGYGQPIADIGPLHVDERVSYGYVADDFRG